MENIKQYKGLFYNQKTSHKFYEGGAHFSYISLVKILNRLKEELNKDRVEKGKEEEKFQENKRETEKGESGEQTQKKLVKKISIPVLTKFKNKSMNYLLEKNANHKKEIIYAKNISEKPKIENTNLNILKIVQKPKKVEYSNSVKRTNAVNKYFNNSIYNNSIMNMPLIYNQKNRSENKTKNTEKNVIIKKNSVLEPLKKKYKNNSNMSSTIGFNENEKYFNYYFLNNYKMQNKISRNKNLHASSSISQTSHKNNNYNSQIYEKINSISNYNKINNYQTTSKKSKINNTKNADFFINDNNYTQLRKNKSKMNYTKVNFSKEKGNLHKIFVNDDKKRDRMNLSIINFSLLKNNNKFLFDKNKMNNYK